MPVLNTPVLVRRADSARQRVTWDAAGRRVLEHESGFLRLLGGPGTGKSTLLAEVAADRIARRNVSPENLLVLTANRASAARMRNAITRRLGDMSETGPRTSQQPLVRTLHSYAFSVLRLRAVQADTSPPRLRNEPEQDAEIRELLDEELNAGAPDWPKNLRVALSADGFARQLRDLLLRAAERGVSPAELQRLGEQYDHPEWTAAGKFGQQYEQITLLKAATEGTAPALDAAEIVTSALWAFEDDPGLLEAERERIRYLLVDDAQQLAPQQYWLLRQLGEQASEFLLAGDPDQAIFSFRGADPRCLLEADRDGARTEVLTVDRRMSKPVRTAVQRLVARLPGSGPQRGLVGVDSAPEGDTEATTEEDTRGSVQVRLLASEAQEATWVADQLRRAHLLDGVAWSDMAVVVRSTGRSLPVLRRALLAAGVPLELPADDEPLAQRTAVRPLLTLVRCAARPYELDADTAAELLESPLGGADALALRRLRRGLRCLELASGGERSSGDLLVEVLQNQDRLAALEQATAEPAQRVARLLRTASQAVESGDGIEETLWKVWKASGLQQLWLARAERGGITGAQADRDLDAVVLLFEAAAEYADRLPGADVAGFAQHLMSQRIAGTSLAPSAPQEERVAVHTAHSAASREWEVVAVHGVQEGTWPDLRSRGSVLGTERLIDVLSGVDESGPVSATAPLLAEERRLLLVAASRARRSLLVSAVRGEDEQPSRFLDELESGTGETEVDERPVLRPERGLVLSELVGELRRIVCDGEQPRRRRERAARQLARLASVGVPGAHPDSWYGLAGTTSAEPLVSEDEEVRVSPSTVELLAKCPLRWMLERHGGQDVAELASITGTLVHALVQQAAEGADAEQLTKALDQAWESVDAGAPWFSRRERGRVERMIQSFVDWLVQSRDELTQVGVERDLDVTVPAREGGPWLRLRGRVDRLEADPEGRPVVVDVKTGKAPMSKKEVAQHPQLAVYQLAAALGAFHDTGQWRWSLSQDDEPVSSGGARLLYVAKPESKTGAATERAQEALDSEGVQVWLDVVHSAAASSTGPTFVAAENSDCPRCPARACCPVHPAGRQVGH